MPHQAACETEAELLVSGLEEAGKRDEPGIVRVQFLNGIEGFRQCFSVLEYPPVWSDM